MSKRFWRWAQNSAEQRTLYLDGVIADESWFDDDVTPEQFRKDLMAGEGDITLWIHSPGGDVFAAAQIYNMLMEYPGNVTVKIDGIAASAASVVAMAGGDVYMSPVSMLMIHNPATIAIGDEVEMGRAKDMLREVKESIINSYELKTGLDRDQIAQMMDAETWLNAKKAVELGFADDILYAEADAPSPVARNSLIFSRQAVTNSLLSKLMVKDKHPGKPDRPAEPDVPDEPDKPEEPAGTSIESLEKRLFLLNR